MLAAALFGTTSEVMGAKERKKGGARRKRSSRGQDQRRDRGSLRAEELPAKCCSSGNCTPGRGKNLSKCCYDGQDLTGKNFKGANLGNASFRGSDLTNANLSGANLDKTCFVGANLTGAKLGGANTGTAIFCGTTMPDGSTIDNSGCENSTPCCPTCAGACPPDPSNNEPGFCCAGGLCSCGGECCAGPDCFIFTTQPRDTEQPPIASELCERPASCVMCGGREEQCCVSCAANGDCIFSGPVSGGSIRRR